jgi:hypothetical protein
MKYKYINIYIYLYIHLCMFRDTRYINTFFLFIILFFQFNNRMNEI